MDVQKSTNLAKNFRSHLKGLKALNLEGKTTETSKLEYSSILIFEPRLT